MVMTFADLTVALGNHSRQKHFQGISVTCLVSLPEVSWRQVIIFLFLIAILIRSCLAYNLQMYDLRRCAYDDLSINC